MNREERKKKIIEIKKRLAVRCPNVTFDGAGHYCKCVPDGVYNEFRRVFCFGHERSCEFPQFYRVPRRILSAENREKLGRLLNTLVSDSIRYAPEADIIVDDRDLLEDEAAIKHFCEFIEQVKVAETWLDKLTSNLEGLAGLPCRHRMSEMLQYPSSLGGVVFMIPFEPQKNIKKYDKWVNAIMDLPYVYSAGLATGARACIEVTIEEVEATGKSLFKIEAELKKCID